MKSADRQFTPVQRRTQLTTTEFRNAPFFPPSSEIQRGVYLQLRWVR